MSPTRMVISTVYYEGIGNAFKTALGLAAVFLKYS